ncbi:hypothetical protein [Sediminispirochaeta bajacaliforniensis]|uniref:hypothetical protein n=1 Tax=Sediminispirochaeta bajacaliforniensis TaxID=148 RepID=UPI00036BB385|nr:hypothetical protein [Sediminispirochaeta bajacaliforniensis]
MRSTFHFFALFSILCTVAVSSISASPHMEGIEFFGGGIWTGNSRSDAGAPSPIYPSLTIGVPLRLGDGPFSFVPALTLYKAWYLYDESEESAIPAELEQRDITAVEIIIDSSFRFDMIKRKSFVTGPELSLSFDLPVPIVVWENEDESSSLVSDLYDSGKFFLPGVGWHWTVILHDTHPLLFNLKSYLPLHRFWDGEDLPFYDRLKIAFRVGYRF